MATLDERRLEFCSRVNARANERMRAMPDIMTADRRGLDAAAAMVLTAAHELADEGALAHVGVNGAADIAAMRVACFLGEEWVDAPWVERGAGGARTVNVASTRFDFAGTVLDAPAKAVQ